MVGGGPGSFIGPIHRMAARLDGRMVDRPVLLQAQRTLQLARD